MTILPINFHFKSDCISIFRQRFEVVAGVNKLDEVGERYRIEKTITDKFDEQTAANDLALVKLRNKIKFSDKVQKIPFEDKYIGGGEDARLTGWGRLGKDSPPPNDLQVDNMNFQSYHSVL